MGEAGLCVLGTVMICLTITTSTVLSGWPEGTYGLPRPKSGCPVDGTFKWEIGIRVHETEFGSHSSTPNDLSGSNPEKSQSVIQEFCIKNTSSGDSLHKFKPGKYCIFKKRECPAHFREGWIYWDDASSLFRATNQSKSGELPDGQFKKNTNVEYCCRNDGYAQQSIELPNSQPFYLLKYGDICQQVSGMTARDDWILWVDESSINLNKHGGMHPKLIRSNNPFTFTKLFYCYYEPSDVLADSYYPSFFASQSDRSSQFGLGLQTILTIIYVTGAIVGIIFMLAILLAGCQRIVIHIKKHRRSCSRGGDVSVNSLESTRLNRVTGYPKNTGTPSPATLSPPPYQQLPMGPLMFRGIRDQRSSEDSLVMCEDGEPPPPYEEVLREQQQQIGGLRVQQNTTH